MPSRKYAKSPFLKFTALIGQALFAFGQPPLFAIKVLLWTVIWIGNQGINILGAIWAIFVGIIETIFWFGQNIKSATSTFIQKIPGKIPKIPKIPEIPKVDFWPKIQKVRQNFKVPSFNFPRVVLPQKIFYLIIGAVATFIFVFIPYWTKSELDQLPNPHLLAVRDIPVSTKIYDRNGILLYQIYSDENRSLVDLNTLPKYVVNATIAIEDKSFRSHLGFDLQGIVRAAFADINGEVTQGGSTITQQLVKSVLLSPERTWERKIKELVLSFWTERLYSKEEIMKMYLNQISYGGAAYGIEAASQTYFAKHAQQLSLAQAALLAGLPSAPSTYSPFGSRPDLARQRQQQVLSAMVSQGYITPDQKNAALSEPLNFAPVETSIKAPHFVMYVKDYLTKKYGGRLVERGGLEVTTTLDYSLYETTTKLVADGVMAQRNLSVGNGAALITNPKTGEILTMVGSIDFFDTAHDGNVNVTLASRSPGSSIKPLNYALAFERGLITPSTVIDDAPVKYNNYVPQNYDNRFHGRVTVRTALASSYNIPAVKVLEKNGVTNFIDFAKKLGITTFGDPSRFGLALTLGGGEVTMLDMATAYSAFANAGTKTDLNPILKITDYRGRVLESQTTSSQQVMSPQTAFLISDILADNSARTPAFGPSSSLVIPNHTVSVKTGTTQEKRDNWTIGYTPNYLVAVWVGNNDNSPMSPYLESGNTGAAAIWNPIMKNLLAEQPDEQIAKPNNLIPVQICTLTGTLPCENCPYVRTEYFVPGTEPKYACKLTKEEVDKILHPENNKPANP